MLINLFFLVVFFVFGGCVGSFLSVVITRIHDGESGILTGRSFCPKCKTQLEWIDLIPFFSFFINKKKCRKCEKEISWFYPAIEGITGLLFAMAISYFNFDIALYYCSVFAVLVACAFFDFKYQLLPDAFSGVLFVLALLGVWAGYTVEWVWAFWGVVALGGFFGLQILISRGKWLGTGDFILGISLGMLLGLSGGIICLIFAYLVGSIFGIIILYGTDKKPEGNVYLPFAPFLCTGAVVAIFWGDQIVRWYMSGFLY